jgi:Xaa-Pro dipeptidase/ectoine hydrolase
MDAHYYTAFCHEKIKQGLPNAKIVDSDRLVNWARLVKSDAEIGYMKSAALISQKGNEDCNGSYKSWSKTMRCSR